MKATYVFYWIGINRHGEKSTGLLEAQNLVVAKMQLREQDIIVHKLTKQYYPLRLKQIKPRYLQQFSRQLATLLQSGLPLTQALNILQTSPFNARLSTIIRTIHHEVCNGSSFAEALQKKPHYFSPLFCNLIAIGEATGLLDVMLDKASNYNAALALNKTRLKQAITYPCLVLIVSLLIAAGLLFFVIPQFVDLYAHLGAQLPLFTQIIISLAQLIQAYAGLGLLIVAMIWLIVHYYYRHKPRFRLRIERLAFKIPILGELWQKINIARFAYTLATTVGAGISLTDSMPFLISITRSILYQHALQSIKADIMNGFSLTSALENTQLYPHLTIQMIAVGEESGRLDTMLTNIANLYEQDITYALNLFHTLLEPLLMVFLGLMIGVLIIAMYLPVLNLGVISG